MKKNKKDLAIIGPYPPPLGGISVHIQRMEYFLRREGIDYTIFDHGSNQNEHVISTKKSYLWYIKFLFNKNFKVVHFHYFSKLYYIYGYFFSLINRTPIIVTLHSQNLIKYNFVIKRIFIFLLKKTRCKQVITVSKKVSEYLEKNKIKNEYIPAHVPAMEINPFKIDKNILKNRHVILFSSSRIDKHSILNIYNFPIVFDFIAKHRDRFHLLLLIGEKETRGEYLNTLIAKYKIEDNITILYEKQLVDYINNAFVLLRPNQEDGYGISIQESMETGVPAIASDVCKRPEGTILFKNNDFEDMERKIFYVLNTSKADILKTKQETTYHLQLLNLYKKLIQKKICKK